jgi:hypothetical protein
MIKAALFTALVGITTALPQVASFMKSQALLPDNNYFQVSVSFAGDFGYRSGYAG